MLARATPTGPNSTSSAIVETAAAYVLANPSAHQAPNDPCAAARATATSRLVPAQTAASTRWARTAGAVDVPRRHRTSSHSTASKKPPATHAPLTSATVDRSGPPCSLGGTTRVTNVRPSGVLTRVAIVFARRVIFGSFTEDT